MRARASAVDSGSTLLGATIGLVFDDDALAPIVDEAIELWRGCDHYGTGFPALVRGRGTRTVRIRWLDRSSGSAKCGSFRGQEIVLFSSARAPNGEPFDCGSLAQNLAHEIGHVFGLGHPRSRKTCRRHIMSDLDGTNAWRRAVRSVECAAVDARWLTVAEEWLEQAGGVTIALLDRLEREWGDGDPPARKRRIDFTPELLGFR